MVLCPQPLPDSLRHEVFRASQEEEEVQARPKEIEDEGPATHVDWTSFDLGASLRNLRSSNEN